VNYLQEKTFIIKYKGRRIPNVEEIAEALHDGMLDLEGNFEVTEDDCTNDCDTCPKQRHI
jgi:hypothetical protein